MKIAHEKVIVVLPAYFAQHTLANVVRKIPRGCVDDIVLVDDASQDRTAEIAKKLGIKAFQNAYNLGYGGNLKICLQKALGMAADIIIELHPDDQYDPSAISAGLQKMREGYDLVVGSRFSRPKEALANAMPFWKFIINRTSTILIQRVLRLELTEFHCGFRIYRRSLLEKIPFQENNNDYLFSFQIIAQACHGGFKIGEVPVTCRYAAGVTQINFRRCIAYGLGALNTLLLLALARWGKKSSLFPQEPLRT